MTNPSFRLLAKQGQFSKCAPLLYLILAVPSFILLLLAYPNFHAPDDSDHFRRAASVLDQPFQIITPPGESSGTLIDSNLARYEGKQVEIGTRPDFPWASETSGINPEDNLRWSGKNEFSTMPAAVTYFPLLYAPQTLAVLIGQSLDLTISQTAFLARIANGVAGIALTFAGLYFLPQGHGFALALLFLPRTMLQFASNSVDPILVGAALLIVGLGLQYHLHSKLTAAATSLALFTISSVKPPLAALALVPGWYGLRNRRFVDVAMMASAVLAAALWILWVLPQSVENRCIGEKGGLVEKGVTFVSQLPTLLYNSFAEHGGFYFFTLIAHFGYGDGPRGLIPNPFPAPFYGLAIMFLAWAIRFDLAEGRRLAPSQRILLCCTALLVTLITFFAMYVVCTAATSNVVAGVQGRYFIPALFALAPAIAGSIGVKHALSTAKFTVGICLWVIVCLAFMMWSAPGLYRL